ncbi:unnamed protein product, partial [Amoebophrya sp. A25]
KVSSIRDSPTARANAAFETEQEKLRKLTPKHRKGTPNDMIFDEEVAATTQKVI